ncbi:MAG TPA: Rpn family recombination-promoting nuclease/putative transposase [Candidatus Xenobia bacterium]
MLNDVVFKFVFAAPKNERVLRSLVNAILGLDGGERIAHVDVLNPGLPKSHVGDRGLVLDLKCRDHVGRLYNIEVQLAARADYIQRSLYYLARLFTEQLAKGARFGVVKRTVGISLLDYTLFPDLEDLHTRYRFHDAQHNRELSDILEIHYIELSKFRRGRPLRNRFERWLEILKFGDIYESGAEPLPVELLEEEEYRMAIESMKEAYADEAIRYEIEEREKAEHQWASEVGAARDEGEAKGRTEGRAEGRAEGQAEGRAEGQAEGRAEGRADVAREMLANGFDEETVLKLTGLRGADLGSPRPRKQ